MTGFWIGICNLLLIVWENSDANNTVEPLTTAIFLRPSLVAVVLELTIVAKSSRMKKHIKNQWKLWQKSFQIPKEEQDSLTKFSFSTSNIYGLPKAHKSRIIQEAIQVQNSEYIKIYEHSDLFNFTINCCRSELSYSLFK